VERAERKLSRTQKDADKLQTEEDFRREYEEYNKKRDAQDVMYYFSKTKDGRNIIQYTKDEYGQPIHVDGQNRMILLIRNGLSRGIIKGKYWEDELENLENERGREDYRAAVHACHVLGIDIDTDATKELIEARGNSAANVDDSRGTTGEGWRGHDKTGRLSVRGAQWLMFKYTDPVSKRAVKISGTQLQSLLEAVSEWQMLHPNPSPTGKEPKELLDFIKQTLDKAIVREDVWHAFKPNEYGVPVGFHDVQYAANTSLQQYFAPSGNTGAYGRNFSDLTQEVRRSELPNTDTIRKFLNNPEIWTSKKGK
jgi:hypothetical protein